MNINEVASELNANVMGSAQLKALGEPPINTKNQVLLPKTFTQTEFANKQFPKRTHKRVYVTVGKLSFMTDNPVYLKSMLKGLAIHDSNYFDKNPNDSITIIIDCIPTTERSCFFCETLTNNTMLTSRKTFLYYLNIGAIPMMVMSIPEIVDKLLQNDVCCINEKVDLNKEQ